LTTPPLRRVGKAQKISKEKGKKFISLANLFISPRTSFFPSFMNYELFFPTPSFRPKTQALPLAFNEWVNGALAFSEHQSAAPKPDKGFPYPWADT
jgi:hypothetical protein